MSEPAASASKDDGAGIARAGQSAGTLMRQAREAAGMHIGALAVALKVPVRKLEALEADRHDLLPDAVFVRALAASVCKTLKTDPAPVLALLPGYVSPRLSLSNRDVRGSFSAPGHGWRVPLLSRLSRPVSVIVSVLLLASLALWLWPAVQDAGKEARRDEAQPEGPSVSTVVVVPVLPSAAAVSASLAVASTAGPAMPAAPVVKAREAPATAAAASGVVLAIRARSASWVEVVDAAGVIQLRKILADGESVSAAGAMPLSVVVGRADVTEVAVRGQAFDLAPHAKDNVARFQVK
ncbi:MAG: helix-turn-helix domain-containing protein [Burkholderiaceae bacterium]